MAKHSTRLNNQKGTIFIIAGLSLLPLMGIAALATDAGLAYLYNTQLTQAGDLSALAGIKIMAKKGSPVDIELVRSIVSETAAMNPVQKDTSVYLNPAAGADIDLGNYSFVTEEFTDVPDGDVNSNTAVNAIRVTVRMEPGANSPYTFKLAKALANLTHQTVAALELESDSVATFGISNTVITMDISGSMDDRNYLPRETCSDADLDRYLVDIGKSIRARGFSFLATHEPPDKSPDSDCITTPHGDYGNAYMPQPITDVFEATRDVLLENKLFNTFYRAGLVVYDSNAYTPDPVTPPVSLDHSRINNKEDLKTHITLALETWRDFALGNRAAPTLGDIRSTHGGLFPFPGGPDYSNTGHTNIGDAIQLSVSQIVAANTATNTKASDLVILLSDGAPNCYRDGGNLHCNRCHDCDSDSSDEVKKIIVQTRARDWAMDMADNAKENQVVIHSIYFETNPAETCDKNNPSAGFQVLEDIAEVTGGQAFCATRVDCDDEDCLKKIFEDLSNAKLFVLVPVTAD